MEDVQLANGNQFPCFYFLGPVYMEVGYPRYVR